MLYWRRTMLLKELVRPEVGTVAFGLGAIVALCCAEAGPAELEQTAAPFIMKSVVAAAPTIGETSPMKGEVPQAILESILKEAAALAKVERREIKIVRAESVVWSDGSLGCPEPGMMYTQMLVNGYWIVVEAAGKNYDFRVGSGGSFRLCPPGQGQPPSQPAAN
jgi:hypothetical protein